MLSFDDGGGTRYSRDGDKGEKARESILPYMIVPPFPQTPSEKYLRELAGRTVM